MTIICNEAVDGGLASLFGGLLRTGGDERSEEVEIKAWQDETNKTDSKEK